MQGRELIDFILRAKENGSSFSHIASVVHRSRSTIARLYYENVEGAPKVKSNWDEKEDNILKAAIANGMSYAAIHNNYLPHRSMAALQSRSHQLKLPARHPSERGKQGERQLDLEMARKAAAMGSASLLAAIKRYAQNHETPTSRYIRDFLMKQEMKNVELG